MTTERIIIYFWETAHLPYPKPTFCPKWELSDNIGLGEGWVGSFPETYNNPKAKLSYID